MGIMNELGRLIVEDDGEGLEKIIAKLGDEGGSEEREIERPSSEEGGGVDGVVKHIETLQGVLDGLDAMSTGDVEKSQDVFDAEKLVRDAIMKLKTYSDEVYKSTTDSSDEE